MKKLIFTKQFPTNDILVYTPKFENLGKIKYSKSVKVWLFNLNSSYLTAKRMEEISIYMKTLRSTGILKGGLKSA